MRIGIDARFYGAYGKGLGRYTEKLIKHLELVDKTNEYIIFLRKENWADYQPANIRFKKVLADYRWYTLTEQIFMPINIWTHKIDVMHFTHFNVPIFYFGKFVVTIHDLILTKYPTERATTLGPLLYRVKHFVYSVTIKSAIRRAKKIIAVSNYTKQEVVKHFNADPEKIHVTYEAVEAPAEIKENDPKTLQKYRIKKPYLLYVGNVYPHKNIEGLLTAFQKILIARPDYYLVIVGKDDYFFKRLKKEVQMRGMTSNVIFTGFVTDTDLPDIYRNAKLYVFPSFCEGFGLPALEACLYGVPVVASNNSSLPEVLDKAALYFDPHNTGEIVTKINQVLDNKEVSDKLVQAGKERISVFTWEKMAAITLDLYTEIK